MPGKGGMPGNCGIPGNAGIPGNGGIPGNAGSGNGKAIPAAEAPSKKAGGRVGIEGMGAGVPLSHPGGSAGGTPAASG